MKIAGRRSLLALALALLLGCTGCGSGTESGQPTPPPSTPPPSSPSVPEADANADWQNIITFNGATYQRRRNLKAVLFLGVDNAELVQAEGDVVGNNGRADTEILFLLDLDAQTTQALVISRDTITEVDVYKGNGDYAYSGQMQITMQYAFGNSDRRSCFLMERTVSRMLYNIPIAGSFALKMDGIPAVVEELGGITLTLQDDYTQIDPSYQAGAQITMDGPAAERFVRYRDITVHGSNENRVERQMWFLHTLFGQLKNRGDPSVVMQRLLAAADDSVETNLDAETLQMLATYPLLDESLKLPGTSTAGEIHDEFYIDESALQSLVVELFYEPVK